MLTWGDTTLVERKPHLASVKGNWRGGEHPNWENTHFHGGPKGLSFMDTVMELVPEVLVVDSSPTGYPRARRQEKNVD